MSNVLKNLPRLTLHDILRRRRSTLENFVKDSGVQTFERLVILCNKIGVVPPPEEEYNALYPRTVNSQQDGVIVVGSPEDEVPSALKAGVEDAKAGKFAEWNDKFETTTKKSRKRRHKKQTTEEGFHADKVNNVTHEPNDDNDDEEDR